MLGPSRIAPSAVVAASLYRQSSGSAFLLMFACTQPASQILRQASKPLQTYTEKAKHLKCTR